MAPVSISLYIIYYVTGIIIDALICKKRFNGLAGQGVANWN